MALLLVYSLSTAAGSRATAAVFAVQVEVVVAGTARSALAAVHSIAAIAVAPDPFVEAVILQRGIVADRVATGLAPSATDQVVTGRVVIDSAPVAPVLALVGCVAARAPQPQQPPLLVSAVNRLVPDDGQPQQLRRCGVVRHTSRRDCAALTTPATTGRTPHPHHRSQH